MTIRFRQPGPPRPIAGRPDTHEVTNPSRQAIRGGIVRYKRIGVPHRAEHSGPDVATIMRMTKKMGAEGQVVIPEELREQTGLGPGDDVAFKLLDDGILVRRAGGRRAPLRGRFAESGMAARLLADRRREARQPR